MSRDAIAMALAWGYAMAGHRLALVIHGTTHLYAVKFRIQLFEALIA